jgi:pimeloyl-ACP methyl ester carboxylesterase
MVLSLRRGAAQTWQSIPDARLAYMPTSSIAALFIHGVGQQTADFADRAQRWLAGALSARGCTLYGRSVHWAPILDAPQQAMAAAVKRGGSAGRPAQGLVIRTLADALSYGHHRDAIHYVMDYEIRQLRADNVVIFAHSLGALIACDYLRSRTGVKVDKLVTFGCNLELFYQGAEASFVVPPQVDAPGKWVNAFDEDDMLGWPVRAWLPKVRDVEVSVGGLLTGWWGLSHTAYFADKRFWTSTVPGRILGL